MAELSKTQKDLISCFRGSQSLTRSELQSRSGYSRVTVSQGIQELLNKKILLEVDGTHSLGGRKASSLTLNSNGGFIGILYFSATSVSLAVADIHSEIRISETSTSYISDGPSEILSKSIQRLVEMLNKYPKTKRLGIVIGVPGPVSHALGKVVNPPIMRGWDQINFQKEFAMHTDLPIYLENDTNLLALAEHRIFYPEVKNLILIKIATGIGGGLIINGDLLRGATGSAGDIGHVQLDALRGLQCRCGHSDCVESFASGWALTEIIYSMGY